MENIVSPFCRCGETLLNILRFLFLPAFITVISNCCQNLNRKRKNQKDISNISGAVVEQNIKNNISVVGCCFVRHHFSETDVLPELSEFNHYIL